MRELISFEHYLAILDQPALAEGYSPVTDKPYICVDAEKHESFTTQARLPSSVVIGIADSDPAYQLPVQSAYDLVVSGDQLNSILTAISNRPLASTTLVQLLRSNELTNTTQGLFAESLAYSTLQQSSEFRNWLKATVLPQQKVETRPILIERDASILTLTLNRPLVRNAYSTALRDALCAALSTASDSRIELVVLKGTGDTFCAGGDLSEFGQVSDAAEAHQSRFTRGAAALLAALNCRTEAYLTGACIGAGIEIPSFADFLSARSDSFFQLPEISMGLVPGAGGTVGISRRIGRQRCAWLAISGQRLDVQTALAWKLIDEIN